MSRQKKGWNNWLLVSGAIALTAVPLFLARGSEFAGSDDKAKDAISNVQPNYKPWFAPLWEPPGSEVQSLLFALQAALGAGTLGFVVGLYRGRSERNPKSQIQAGNEPQD